MKVTSSWDDDDEIKDIITSLKGRNLLWTTKEGLRLANGVSSDTKGSKALKRKYPDMAPPPAQIKYKNLDMLYFKRLLEVYNKLINNPKIKNDEIFNEVY